MGTGDKRTLELTVISASGLKKVRTFGPDNCYAVASIDGQERAAWTRVSKENGSNPSWNSKLLLTFEGTETIRVEIYSRGAFNKKLVGTSTISLQDAGNLINSGNPLSYQVCRPSGEAKGLLYVSMKVFPPAQKPNSCKGDTSPASDRADSRIARVSPSSPASSTAMVGNAGRVYPASSSSTRRDGGSAAHPVQVYSPPQVLVGDNSEAKVPVNAFPASGYGAFQLQAPNQCSLQDTQAYHPSASANVPYNYLQAYYSKPSRLRR